MIDITVALEKSRDQGLHNIVVYDFDELELLQISACLWGDAVAKWCMLLGACSIQTGAKFLS